MRAAARVEGVLGVLAGRRAAGEERLQRLRGELDDVAAVDPARPAALELELARREHAELHGSVWTITSATSGRARRSRSSTSLARACASASVAPGSRPSVTKATTPWPVRNSRSARGGPPAALLDGRLELGRVHHLARVRLGERLEMGLHGGDLGDGLADRALDLLGDLVRLVERQIARELEVQRELARAAERDDAEVVDLADVRHGQRRRVRALAERGVRPAGLDMDDDVAAGQRPLERRLDPVRQRRGPGRRRLQARRR